MTRRTTAAAGFVGGLAASLVLVGCAGAGPDAAGDPASSQSASQPIDSRLPTATAEPLAPSVPPEEPRRSYLSIPALGLRSVTVVRYVGSPDDAQGTRIQNRGPAASPRGPGGGVGPGEIGNHIVTGHRTSHAAPFRDLPAVRVGDRVQIRSGSTVFVYRIVGTRSTSFRSPRSLAAQSAAVPGRPGVPATRAMITLSTCATPEDHAAGNYWSDRFGNPEHRIDKIGVLVGTRAVSA